MTTPRTASDRHAFPLLDGARGVAALAVVGFHAVASMKIHALFEFAFLGVDFFFLLSGFVLGHAYGERLRAGGWLGRFATARFVRLYPMIVLGTLIGALVLPQPHGFGSSLALGLLMIPQTWGPPGSLLFPLDPALWSLFFELVANAAFALFALRAGPRTLLAICLVSLPLVAVGASLHVGWETGSFLYGFPRTAFSFSAGLLLQRLHAAGRLPRWPMAAPYALVALAAVLALPLPMSHGRFPILLFDVAVLFPAMLVALASYRPGRLASAVCLWAGETSYPLYAIHVPMVQATGMALLAAHAAGSTRVAAVFGLMASMTLLATLVARFVDAPARAWLSARLRRRAALTEAPAAA